MNHIEIFEGDSQSEAKNKANEWAKEYNLRIISASLTIKEYKYSYDTYYLTVVFEEN